MAIEAAFEMVDPAKQISSFRLQDIQLTAAAILSTDADVECIVQLRPYTADTCDSSSTWTELTVTSSPDGKALMMNCCGLLFVEYEHISGFEDSQERTLELQTLKS